MSFTTRCPACGTMFKVVADQLKISDGWVRCGHCADVFDATLYLQEQPAAPRSASVPVPPHARTPDAPASAPAPLRPTVRLSVARDAQRPPPLQHGAQPTTPVQTRARPAGSRESGPANALRGDSGRAPLAPAMDSGWLLPPQSVPDLMLDDLGVMGETGRKPASAKHDEGRESLAFTTAPKPRRTMPTPTERDTDFAPLDDSQWPSVREPDIDLWAEQAQDSSFHQDLERFAASGVPPQSGSAPAGPSLLDDLNEPVAASRAAPAPPAFVLQARRNAFWRSRPMQLLLVLLTVSLSVLLLMQWAVHDRDRLAARHPALGPWLTALCQPLNCRLSAPQNIEAVVIDSSQLVRRLGSFFSFDLVLKNNASMDVATPALELTLTDNRDAVIARRVFLPSDLPGAPGILAARTSVPVELRLSLADADASAMTGYRALVFYP